MTCHDWSLFQRGKINTCLKSKPDSEPRFCLGDLCKTLLENVLDLCRSWKENSPKILKNHGCRSAIFLSITLGHGVNAIRLLPWHQRNPTCSILISVTPAMLPIASVDLVKNKTRLVPLLAVYRKAIVRFVCLWWSVAELSIVHLSLGSKPGDSDWTSQPKTMIQSSL